MTSRLVSADRILVVLLPATIVAIAMASSSVDSAMHVGRPLRWLALVALSCVSVWYGWEDRERLPRWLWALVGAIACVALLSASWSVAPRLTVERAMTFVALGVVALFVGCGASRSERRREGVGVALLIGPVVIALAGLVVLGVDHSLAVQAAQSNMPARLRGFGQNPNTSAVLFAVALPLAVAFVLHGGAPRVRVTAAVVVALLYGSILGSGSRGAILGACAGVAVSVAMSVRGVRIGLAAEAVVVVALLLSVTVAGSRPSAGAAAPAASKPSSKPSSNSGASGEATPPAAPGTAAAGSSGRWSVNLAPTLPRADVPVPFVQSKDEIGYPGLYEYKPLLAYGSGRVYAWIYAIRTGLKSPVLGYGFGTEDRVFQDRLQFFEGDFTENSFVGVFLQLGLVGLLLFLIPFVLVALGAVRMRRADDSRVAATAAGVVASGFVVAFFQSYLYSVGNVATLTFWIGLAIAAVALASAGRSLPGPA